MCLISRMCVRVRVSRSVVLFFSFYDSKRHFNCAPATHFVKYFLLWKHRFKILYPVALHCWAEAGGAEWKPDKSTTGSHVHTRAHAHIKWINFICVFHLSAGTISSSSKSYKYLMCKIDELMNQAAAIARNESVVTGWGRLCHLQYVIRNNFNLTNFLIAVL